MKNVKTYEEYTKGSTFKELIFNDDLDKIVDLTCSNKNLIDLNGIENYTHLERLWCYNNKITSLEPIENLTNLILLNYSHNDISSLKPIENLTKLKELYCHNNPIDWIDYIDKQGRTYYIKLPKSIYHLASDKFKDIEEYYKFMDKNQPASVSRKFNF